MATIARLLPSVRPQMTFLPPLLIFPCALCVSHLTKKQQEKTGEEGPFEERDKEGGLRLARCTSAVCEQVLLSILYI